jgi:hypothetical protein
MNVGRKILWPTFILIMKISVGSKTLLWLTVIRLFSVVTYELVKFEK